MDLSSSLRKESQTEYFFLSIDNLSYLQLLDITVYQCTICIYHYFTGSSRMQSDGPRHRTYNARKSGVTAVGFEVD